MLQVNESYRIHLMDIGLVFLNKPSGFYFWKGTALKINRDGRGSVKQKKHTLQNDWERAKNQGFVGLVSSD